MKRTPYNAIDLIIDKKCVDRSDGWNSLYNNPLSLSLMDQLGVKSSYAGGTVGIYLPNHIVWWYKVSPALTENEKARIGKRKLFKPWERHTFTTTLIRHFN